MKILSKTMRQVREHTTLQGFNLIRHKYDECMCKLNKSNYTSVNREFLSHNVRVKTECGMRVNNLNKYERKWVQEVNKIKKN